MAHEGRHPVVLHRNSTIEEQRANVAQVTRYEIGKSVFPTIRDIAPPAEVIARSLKLMADKGVTGVFRWSDGE